MGAFAPGPDQVGVRRRVGEEGGPVCQLAGLFADQLAELEGRGGLVGGEGREERRGFVDPADFEAPAGAGQRFGVTEAGQGRGEDLLRAGRMGGDLELLETTEGTAFLLRVPSPPPPAIVSSTEAA